MQPSKPVYIDPARFKYRVTFWQESAIPDGAGGYTQGLEAILTTWGAKDEARTSLSYNDLVSIAAGQVIEGRDIEVYIRARKDFTPKKDMRMEVQGQVYLLTNPGTEMGDPVKYIRLVGKLEK